MSQINPQIINVCPTDFTRLLDFINDEFIPRNPMYALLNISTQEAEISMKILLQWWLKENCSYLMVDKNKNNTIIGICLNSIIKVNKSDPVVSAEEQYGKDVYKTFTENLKHIEKFIDQVDKGLAESINADTEKTVLRVEIICVANAYKCQGWSTFIQKSTIKINK